MLVQPVTGIRRLSVGFSVEEDTASVKGGRRLLSEEVLSPHATPTDNRLSSARHAIAFSSVVTGDVIRPSG